MAELSEMDVQKLFRRWRKGDAQASGYLAQRFSDWYYAITAVRLGDKDGRAPMAAACARFESGIVQVSRSADLVPWAHDIVKEEFAKVGGRSRGGDFPNALTKGRSPSELLRKARAQLDEEQVSLLHMAYGHGADLDALTQACEPRGGFPMALLAARYALKAALRDAAKVPLSVVPDSPNLDLAPLPLYEAGRMEHEDEEWDFEMWLISDIELCKDVAEFATFSHALRAGVFAEAAPAPAKQAPAAPKAEAPPAPAKETAPAAPAKKGGISPILIGLGLLFVLGFLAVLAGAAFFALR